VGPDTPDADAFYQHQAHRQQRCLLVTLNFQDFKGPRNSNSRTFKVQPCFQVFSRPWIERKNSRTFKDAWEPWQIHESQQFVGVWSKRRQTITATKMLRQNGDKTKRRQTKTETSVIRTLLMPNVIVSLSVGKVYGWNTGL